MKRQKANPVSFFLSTIFQYRANYPRKFFSTKGKKPKLKFEPSLRKSAGFEQLGPELKMSCKYSSLTKGYNAEEISHFYLILPL